MTTSKDANTGTPRDTRRPKVSRCRSCHARIFWAVTMAGKTMPVDADPPPEGNVVIEAWDDDTRAPIVRARDLMFDGHKTRYRSHSATCPDSDQHRKKKQ